MPIYQNYTMPKDYGVLLTVKNRRRIPCGILMISFLTFIFELSIRREILYIQIFIRDVTHSTRIILYTFMNNAALKYYSSSNAVVHVNVISIICNTIKISNNHITRFLTTTTYNLHYFFNWKKVIIRNSSYVIFLFLILLHPTHTFK